MQSQPIHLETNLIRIKGTACYAPYTTARIYTLIGREGPSVPMRIDTGADITCVPGEAAKCLFPLVLGRPVLIRGHSGKVRRHHTHRLMISLDLDGQTRNFTPHRGVLLTDSNIGLLGMDIIGQIFNLPAEEATINLAMVIEERNNAD